MARSAVGGLRGPAGRLAAEPASVGERYDVADGFEASQLSGSALHNTRTKPCGTHRLAWRVRAGQWEPTERFDLMTSGQAWHWIDPDHGYRNAAELLRPGGRLALFWNDYVYDAATHAVFDVVVSRHAPQLLVNSIAFGTSSPDHSALNADMLRRSVQWFTEPEFQVFTHDRRQSIEDWLAEMQTHSPMATLDQDVRRACSDESGVADL